MAETSTFENLSYRIRRDASGVWAWCKNSWREKRWFRWGAIALGIFLALWLVLWIILARNLPDAETLLDYEPPLPTVVRGIEGDIVHSYARERRVQLQYADFPQTLIEAYLAAEDKTFFSHGGIDAGGLAGAVIDYVSKLGSDERAVGGSTITQQVAKNILLTNEYSVTRKLKEMMLARRIEGVLTKQQILELYLNEIPLGRRSFGVQAASRAYFDKDVGDLELHEMAFLAILPKAPEVYGRAKNADSALARRNFVLGQMAENEFITAAQADAAKAMPLGLVTERSRTRSVDAGYFLEEVRRELIGQFCEAAEDCKNSVYGGGLWVRTSLDPEMQDAARNALRRGMVRYHGNRGWGGPIATIDMGAGNWSGQLASSFLGINYEGWRIGVVTEREGSSAKIGFSDGEEAPLTNLPNALKAGDVIAVEKSGNGFRVRTLPGVSGGFVAQDPQTGRVLAMQGGFDSRLGSFNRATQANRQPGSTIKPFVYATGLDNGMTPASEIPDQTYCYYQGSQLGEKCFRNSGGGGGGMHTMRWGLEQSRNLMTVHIAMESGMPKVVDMIENVGIGSYDPYPAFALGAGETTVMKMVNAYSALANHGRLNKPTVIDYVQDRRGKVIYRADKRACNGCNMPEWDGKPMPRIAPSGEQALDARTAFQTVHMLEGVVKRGTGTVLRNLDIPMFGKTGTTTGPKDVWFVGGTPDVIAGAYIGYDTPRNLGGYAQGGTVAAPIIRQFFSETKERMSGDPFVAPAGVRMVRVDRISGKRVFDAWPGSDPKASVIWEAFKPDTEPPRITRRDEIESKRKEIIALIKQGSAAQGEQAAAAPREDAPEDFVEDQGGIY
ncbi:transglycosylase domain-containing protein [Pontixanthobacter aestiaquae]|uniref:Penicillin-binding protein n=1 Tax=Pontixanthobacter aestiaquae TaxID=1509367 RepID=A0A844Z9M3_9SPHN|nr:transglycosylase domain-containing protein [Pontixanthobacter aestiaquae]MDN3645295.1 transglycosylase domain-containing protein [Pontixanthobacter aestiaquae]MXO83703.1 penicillin-binding protein [Pontixanthobacter aestiaquae]